MPKRKTLDMPQSTSSGGNSATSQKETFRCACCGKKYARQESNFFKSKSPVYVGNNNYLPYCKTCVNKLLATYTEECNGDELRALERICQLTDVFFDEKTWTSLAKDTAAENKLGIYISRANLGKNGHHRTYFDTELGIWDKRLEEEIEKQRKLVSKQWEEQNADRIKKWKDEEATRKSKWDMEDETRKLRIAKEDAERKKKMEETRKLYEDEVARMQAAENAKVEVLDAEEKVRLVPEEVIRRFGKGFTAEEYDSMQYEYASWENKYGEPEDKRQEELYVSICYMKLNLQKSVQSGNSSGQLANSYKSLIEAATTEIEDRKRKAESQMELKPLGVLAHDIEQYTPAEYFKDKSLFKDYDNLETYCRRFLERPLVNLMTGSKDEDSEFRVLDEGESNV